MKKRSLPLGEVYRLLEPGPVVLVSTAWQGVQDVMPMTWHCMMEFEPPLVGCLLSGHNESFTALVKSRECVLNIPTAELLDAVVGCGNTHRSAVDKFARFALTAAPAQAVGAPLIAECFANLECRLVDTRWQNRYNFFVLEVVQAWAARVAAPRTLHHRGRGRFMIAGEEVRTKSKMK